MKLTYALLLLVILLTGCASERNAEVDELPMYVGIEKSKDYTHTPADKSFVSSQIVNHLVGREKAALLWIRKGFSSYHEGNLRDAMKQFNKAWLIDSANPDTYWGYTLILSKQGQHCDAVKTLEIALSKGPMRNQFLHDAGFAVNACAIEDDSLSKQEKDQYFKRADSYFEQATPTKQTPREHILRDWIKALSARGDDAAAMDKLIDYAELTGRTLAGKPVDYLTDRSGSIMGFTPFDTPQGYGVGAIIDYGYTGLKHRLLFDPNYIVNNAKADHLPILDAHFRAPHKKSTLTYNDKEKRKLLNTIKQQLIDNARRLSVNARNAIHKMDDIEITADHAEHVIAPGYKRLQYDLIESIPAYSGTIQGIKHNIDTAKKPLVIIGVDLFNKAVITVHFDKSVDLDAKFEILDNVHFDTVGLRMDAKGNLNISYHTPNLVVFRAVEFDRDALHHYLTKGALP